MANNKKISQLNPLAVAASTDLFPLVDTNVPGWETKRITLSEIMGSPGTIGSTTPGSGEFSALTLNGDLINEFSTDGTLGDNSDMAVPTEKAVKTYVDTAVLNAVHLNIVYTSIDTTAVIGDVIIVDSGSGDINIELVLTGVIGKIIVYKNSTDGNNIIMTPNIGTIDSNPTDTFNFPHSSKEYLTDGAVIFTI